MSTLATPSVPPGTIATTTVTPGGTVSTVSTPVDRGLPLVPTLLLLGLFLVIAVGLVFWIFVSRNALKTRDLNVVQSPYCPVIQCPSGTQNTNYQLDPSQTPSEAMYQTLNFCTISAPPTAFVQSLEVCGNLLNPADANAGGSTITPPTPAQVTSFATFYNQQYVDTCGWSWRNPPPEDATQPNSQGDPVITALAACAQALNITDNTDIQQLQTKCGSACNLLPLVTPTTPST